MESVNQEVNADGESQINITDLLLDYLANWKWFVLSLVVCIAAAVLYIATRIPVYQIDASIYLSEDNSSGQNAFNLSNAADPMVAFKNYIDETELEVLKSRNNLLKIVDSLQLAYSYYKKGTLRDEPLYEDNAVSASMPKSNLHMLKYPIKIEVSPTGDSTCDIKVSTFFDKVRENKEYNDVTLPYSIDLSRGTVVIERSPVIKDFDYSECIYIQNPKAVAKELSENLNIEFAKNSEKIMRVSLRDEVNKRGVDILECLLDFYNKDIIEDKNKSAVQTEAFIIDRLVMINNELKDVETRLQQYRQVHNITDLQAQSALNLNLQSDYEKEAAEVEAEMAIYDAIQAIVSNSDTYESLPSAVSDPTISSVIEGYNRKVGLLNRQLEGSTPDNPLIVSMQQELSRDKTRILQNLVTARRNLNTKHKSIQRLENQSQGNLASTPSLDKGFQEIFREQQVKVNIYTFLLQRREEIALQKTLATNTARLIDDPDPDNDVPVSPRKVIILALAFLLGLAIPAVIIFIRRTVFPVFSDKEELQKLTHVPVIGEICVNESKNSDDNIVIGENVATPIAELFRLLRNNISFTSKGSETKVILVTSTVSGEGKTFISSNLAMTYALMGKKTLVIGMDLRRPMLAYNFGFSNARGVTTFLSGQEHDLNSLIQQSKENDNLYVLPAGPIPPNPNELLSSRNMDELIKIVRNEFDYVVIDSAPVGVVSDTYLILRRSDIQLYVTRANYSTKNALSVLHEAVSTDKFQSVYIVLNGVNMGANSYVYRRYGQYGHYGRYGRTTKNGSYGYGYGYGYSSKDSAGKSKKK
ncbi:MAG: polysaccharide biosynthesis tyrosine autokinase [Muribaculaceae bacterium]|nr:polysaccharide biosynthesis tyrosine autokinase [Muribaculaceae bacterium]